MATGEKKKTLDRIYTLFGDKSSEMPKLLQMLQMMAINKPNIPQMPQNQQLEAPTPMQQEQSALETQYPFRK